MGILNQKEINAFNKLFNSNGYVLNFNTSQFDAFTTESIGIPLCEKYQLSKGKSLLSFMKKGSDDLVIKLLKDLLEYYETELGYQIKKDEAIEKLYKRCKAIVEKLYSIPLSTSAESLKEKFSNKYISSQIDQMINMHRDNPTEAIGKAKELIESCCKTILENNSVEIDKNWNINHLVKTTLKNLKLTPEDIPDTAPEVIAIKALLGNLQSIANNVSNIRNAYGSGHGKSASYKGLEERHAKLAVGCSITLVQFLWDSYEKQVSM